MAGGLDEEETAMDPTVLNVTVPLGGEFLSQIRRVLILDIFDNGVPAETGVSIDLLYLLLLLLGYIPSVVVDLIAVSRGIDNIEPETNSVFLDDWERNVSLYER